MTDERIPKQIPQYKAKGHSDGGRPWKRWKIGVCEVRSRLIGYIVK